MTAFESLRQGEHPVMPDPAFTRRLRAQLEAALSPAAMSDVHLPERSSTVTTTETTPAATTAGATAARRSALTAYLTVAGAARAIEWYTDVFGGRETVRYTDESDGRIGHAEIEFDGVTLMLSDEYPDYGAVAPTTLGGTAVTLHVEVPDVDAVWQRAIAGGADGQRPPTDQPYGERSGTFVDPFGHRWMVATTTGEPTLDEIQQAADGFTITAPADDAEPDV